MKNKKKEISLYKYQLGKIKVWGTNMVFIKKYFDFNFLKNTLYLKFYNEILFFLLTKLSKYFFRNQYKNKKRKLLYILKQLSSKYLQTKFFCKKSIFYKKKYFQNIKTLKKKYKFRFKQYRIKKKFFFNNIITFKSIYVKKSIVYVYCNLAFLYKKKFLSLKKLKKNKVLLYVKKKKILLLQLLLLKLYLEQYFFSILQLSIKFYFYNYNNYKTNMLFKYLNKHLYVLKQIKQKKKNFKLKNFFFKKFDFFYNKLKLLSLIAFTLNDVKLLLQQFSERLTKIYKHKYALKQFLEFCQKINIMDINNYGIKILIYGKINAKTRTKKAVIYYSKKPTTHTISNSIEYNYLTSYTYTGTFGIHIWFVKASV